ncbi:MAG: hypothetical protein IT240_02830 [Bacteroidia bacterium]|nr:hypothetical protein [Bacteroidia bacterium]
MSNTVRHPGIRVFKWLACYCLLLSWPNLLFAQQKPSFVWQETGLGLITFKGDIARTKPSFVPSLSLGYQKGKWEGMASLHHAILSWNQQEQLNLDNFRAEITHFDLRARYNLLLPSETSPFAFFISAGLGHAWFSSYTDLHDSDGKGYIPWSDGTLRNLPEIPEFLYQAQKLKRDFVYETPLAIRQTAIYVPVELGLSFQISPQVQLGFSWERFMLQSDNLDRNTNDARWDQLNRYALSLRFNIVKHEKVIKQIPLKKTIPYEPGIDPQLLLFSDEDSDGVADLYDMCLGTPAGITVNLQGCPPDTDGDGIPDYLDKETATPAGTWVDENGVARSDQWIQNQYNDSLAWFTFPLRKAYRVNRPYPVKKFIPKMQYEIYARMLEQNPSWRAVSAAKEREIPIEFRAIDTNNDRIISLPELHHALQLIFDQQPGALSPEMFNNALRYAFEVQN